MSSRTGLESTNAGQATPLGQDRDLRMRAVEAPRRNATAGEAPSPSDAIWAFEDADEDSLQSAMLFVGSLAAKEELTPNSLRNLAAFDLGRAVDNLALLCLHRRLRQDDLAAPAPSMEARLSWELLASPLPQQPAQQPSRPGAADALAAELARRRLVAPLRRSFLGSGGPFGARLVNGCLAVCLSDFDSLRGLPSQEQGALLFMRCLCQEDPLQARIRDLGRDPHAAVAALAIAAEAGRLQARCVATMGAVDSGDFEEALRRTKLALRSVAEGAKKKAATAHDAALRRVLVPADDVRNLPARSFDLRLALRTLLRNVHPSSTFGEWTSELRASCLAAVAPDVLQGYSFQVEAGERGTAASLLLRRGQDAEHEVLFPSACSARDAWTFCLDYRLPADRRARPLPYASCLLVKRRGGGSQPRDYRYNLDEQQQALRPPAPPPPPPEGGPVDVKKLCERLHRRLRNLRWGAAPSSKPGVAEEALKLLDALRRRIEAANEVPAWGEAEKLSLLLRKLFGLCLTALRQGRGSYLYAAHDVARISRSLEAKFPLWPWKEQKLDFDARLVFAKQVLPSTAAPPKKTLFEEAFLQRARSWDESEHLWGLPLRAVLTEEASCNLAARRELAAARALEALRVQKATAFWLADEVRHCRRQRSDLKLVESLKQLRDCLLRVDDALRRAAEDAWVAHPPFLPEWHRGSGNLSALLGLVSQGALRAGRLRQAAVAEERGSPT